MRSWWLPALLLAGCAGADSGPGDLPQADADCPYPEGAVEPMAQGEVLSPYFWPLALNGDRQEIALDLVHAPCDSDPVLDWSPFDVLLFVSIPAW